MSVRRSQDLNSDILRLSGGLEEGGTYPSTERERKQKSKRGGSSECSVGSTVLSGTVIGTTSKPRSRGEPGPWGEEEDKGLRQ